MLTAIGDVMRECYKRGWITTRDGNCSLRKSLDGIISDNIHITPKGVRKNIIFPEHIIKLNMKADNLGFPVSTEFYMHHKLLYDAVSTRAVLHVHPTHVVAAILAGWNLQEMCKAFPEISRYTRVGPSVSVQPAGSQGLAMETNLRFRQGNDNNELVFDIVGQANHGACAVGKNPWDAFEHIERLNHICEIVLASGIRPESVVESKISVK
jgi:ribulose-5-phosphate 4-epimerase/fuculose-1-phosphate aldolase